jgi:NADPH:quinone reductase-like Zn-dependent oxidoreductase
MRAVVVTRHGPPEVLAVQQRPDPVPGPGQVRIAVEAAGLNFADVLGRAGMYPDAPPTPCVLGYEVAGRVDATGSGVEAFEAGDRVVAHLARLLTPLRDLLQSGVIRPVVDSTFPFDRAADAHRRLMSGANIGKVLLTPN